MEPKRHDRFEWVDALKGIGITLVVLGHAVRGIHAAGLMSDDLFAAIDSRIYVFHMPLFFFLSGFFLAPSIARATPITFVRTRTTQLFYPMVLWTYVFLGCKYIAGNMTNTPMTLNDVSMIPVPGYLHFWFLWTLIVLQSFAFVVAKSVPVNHRDTWPFIALGLGIFFYVADPKLTLLPTTIRPYAGQAGGYAVYIFAGAVLFPILKSLSISKINSLLFAFVFVAFVMATPVLIELGVSKFLLASVLSVSAVLCVKGWKPKSTDLLPLMGVASLAIYVTHTIVSAAFREVAIIYEITSTIVHVLGGTLVGLLVPFWSYRLAIRWGIAAYVGWR